MKLLVVDDDLDLLALISFTLRQAGYMVLEAHDGPTALDLFKKDAPDLAILDWNLPRMNGLEILRLLRAAGSKMPVMMLTVRSSEEDQVKGLDAGADDYLTKPFSPRTLLARVRALLRRSGSEKPISMTAGVFSLDPELLTAAVGSRPAVRLTTLEFRLLQLLVANAGRPLTVERLTGHVWGHRGLGDRQLLKQLVHRLRQKIESDPSHPDFLQTVGGVGYLLETTRVERAE